MKFKLIIIFPSQALVRSPRVFKLLSIIKETNPNIELWCWKRNKNEEVIDSLPIKVLLTGGGDNNKRLLFWYLLWMFVVLKKALFTHGQSKFYCVRFDSAFPIAIVGIFRKIKFIFDNNDNLSKSYNWPKFVKNTITFCERWIVENADIHIVPSNIRWNGNKKNLKVVKNTPLRETFINAKSIAKKNNYSKNGIFTVYVNGWLTKNRGLETLYKAIKLFSKKEIRILLAGKIICPEAELLVKLEIVEYVGQIKQDEALALYYDSNIAFTFYNPEIEINRIAEPNKWYDCILTKTPFIANSEIETLLPFLNNNACYSVNYNDYKSLSKLFNYLINNPQEIDLRAASLGSYPIEFWDDSMGKVLEEFI